jgi:hypothetical protein
MDEIEAGRVRLDEALERLAQAWQNRHENPAAAREALLAFNEASSDLSQAWNGQLEREAPSGT